MVWWPDAPADQTVMAHLAAGVLALLGVLFLLPGSLIRCSSGRVTKSKGSHASLQVH